MMKRMLCCLLLLFLCMTALAAPARVADNADLLTDQQESALLARADALSEKYAVDVIIATTNDSRGMVLGDYAADLVDYNDFRTANIILTVAMDQRKYVCVTSGRAIYVFSDYTLEAIYDAMESDMRAGNYASAFDTYLTLCDRALEQVENGSMPYDYDQPLDTRSLGEILLMRLGIAGVPGIIIGWLIAWSRKKRMNSAVPQRSAHNYMTNMRLTNTRDIYLYTTTTRRRIQSNNGGHGGHGGGSSTFRGSSGRSHGGGGGGRGF